MVHSQKRQMSTRRDFNIFDSLHIHMHTFTYEDMHIIEMQYKLLICVCLSVCVQRLKEHSIIVVSKLIQVKQQHRIQGPSICTALSPFPTSSTSTLCPQQSGKKQRELCHSVIFYLCKNKGKILKLYNNFEATFVYIYQNS